LAPMESFRVEVFARGEAAARLSDAGDARRTPQGMRAAVAAAKPPGAKPTPKPKVGSGLSPAAPPRRRT
jgi:hypothetical protein